jgi:hypothetical protein
MIVFWVIAPYSLIEVDRRFGGAYCLHRQGYEVVSTSETSVSFYRLHDAVSENDFLVMIVLATRDLSRIYLGGESSLGTD